MPIRKAITRLWGTWSSRRSNKPYRYYHKGTPDQALVYVYWPAPDAGDPADRYRMRLLRGLFRNRLSDVLREEMGSTYSPGTASYANDLFDDYGYLYARVTAKPDEVDKVREVLRVANEMANTPIDEDTFIRAWTPIVEDLDSSLENNSYWLSVLGDAQTDASGLTRFRVREPAYRNMTAEEISALAKQVFGGSNEISAYILPAKNAVAKAIVSRPVIADPHQAITGDRHSAVRVECRSPAFHPSLFGRCQCSAVLASGGGPAGDSTGWPWASDGLSTTDQRDLVAAGVLRLAERKIGAAGEIGRGFARGQLRKPERGGHLLLVSDRCGQFGPYPLTQDLGRSRRLLDILIGKDQREFLPAEACHEVLLSGGVGKQPGERNDRLDRPPQWP